MGRWEEEEEGEEDSLHTVYLHLYPELIAYPCLFDIVCFTTQLCEICNKEYSPHKVSWALSYCAYIRLTLMFHRLSETMLQILAS